MKKSFIKNTIALCMAGSLLVSPLSGITASAATVNIDKLKINQSTINQLLTEDITLQSKLSGQTITYSVGSANPDYVRVDGNTLKITRPYSGEGNYSFTLTASITQDGVTTTKNFPLTIAEGLTGDSYAGYLYVCFTDDKNKGNVDVQQIHFYLSEDGLNWTALNGNQPAFLTGKDHVDKVKKAGANSVNYVINEGVDISKTTTGDASVLFPFEGKDQGVRDPYMIRGCKADGSDSGKLWILATDLNTHSANYGPASNLADNKLANDTWAKCSDSRYASQSLFIWETDDLVNWTRRYIDVGSEVNADMAWAPEAIYNPEKDNYLVFWSGRTDDDGSSRDRLYCNETYDFVEFGPTMLYENEPFYTKYGSSGVANNSGYGNIDTSMLWVGGKDADGNYTDYKTLYRTVKDETNNHIELQSATTVFDPSVEWSHVVKDSDTDKWVKVTEQDGKWIDEEGTVWTGRVWDYADTTTIDPYTLDGKTYARLSDLSSIPNDTNDIKRAEIVYNWYKDRTVGDHFTGIDQEVLQFGGTGTKTYHEGATMFKFIDRDEWCIMVDNYGNMAIRYEPYTTTNLASANSVTKLSSGYGRTAGDIGCHGGMIPITVKEYNTMIDTYNSDSSVNNYHPIEKITADKRALEETAVRLAEVLKKDGLSDEQKLHYQIILNRANRLIESNDVDGNTVNAFVKFAEARLSVAVETDTSSIQLAVGTSKKINVKSSPSYSVKWKSVDNTVATVSADGTIKAVGKGSTFVFAKAGNKGIAVIKVEVK